MPATKLPSMGMNAIVAILHRELSDEELAAIGLRPSGETVTLDEVTLFHDFEVGVVRDGGWTVIMTGSAPLLRLSGTPGRRPELPGTWYLSCSGSTAHVYGYQVLRDGELLREVWVTQDGERVRGEPVGEEPELETSGGPLAPDGNPEDLLWLPFEASGLWREHPVPELLQRPAEGWREPLPLP